MSVETEIRNLIKEVVEDLRSEKGEFDFTGEVGALGVDSGDLQMALIDRTLNKYRNRYRIFPLEQMRGILQQRIQVNSTMQLYEVAGRVSMALQYLEAQLPGGPTKPGDPGITG